MKKLVAYVIIYSLIFNVAYGIELQSPKLSVSDKMKYESIPDGTPEDQFEHARLYERASDLKKIEKSFYKSKKDQQRLFATMAYKEFVERNPKHKLAPLALLYYGLLIDDADSYKDYKEYYDARTTPFEILYTNYPESINQKYADTTIYEYAYFLHLAALEFVISDLMYDQKKDKDFKDFRKKFCDDITSKDPRHLNAIAKFKNMGISQFTNTYESFKCSQVHGGLDQTVKTPEGSTETQTGFKIDLLINNPDLSNLFTKYEIIFDFKNFIVKQVISYKSTKVNEVTRSFETISIDDKKIRMQETIKEFIDFCGKLDSSFGGAPVRDEIGYIIKKNTPVEECNVPEDVFWSEYKNSDQTMYQPYLYMDFYLQTGEMVKTYFPLSLKKRSYSSKRNFKNPLDNFDKYKKNKNIGAIVEFLLLAATVYLVITKLKAIISIAKGGSKSTLIKSSGSSTKAPCIYFACRSYKDKIYILKMYGAL